MKKLILRRVLIAVGIPVAIRGTRALAEQAATRSGSSRYAPGLHQVADALQRRRAATR